MQSRPHTWKSGGRNGVKNDNSVMIQLDSPAIPPELNRNQKESAGIKPPRWYEFEAATPVFQRYKALRVCGFVTCAGGAVATMYLGRPPTEQVLALLGCILYVLAFDPFAAVGAILARASRFILASAVCLVGMTIVFPSAGLLLASTIWLVTALIAVRRFNRRYLMQDTFASAKAIPDAIRTAPESKAGQAWRRGGAKVVNGMAAELGATCKDYAEIKVRELAYYIGYQTADGRTQELVRRCEKLRLENALLKDAEAEKSNFQRTIDELTADNQKRLERANIERQRLLGKIRELEDANLELLRLVPEEVETAPAEDTVEGKLEYAFRTLHMTDKEAADYAECSQKKAWKYRKDNNIEPRGGKT